MGSKKQVMIGEEVPEIGGPIAEHHGKKKEKEGNEKANVKEEIKKAKIEKAEKEEADEQVEEKTEKPKSSKEDKKTEEEREAPKKEKQGKAKVRSKKYQSSLSQIEKGKRYEIEEAIALAKKTNYAKFDASVELHIKIGLKPDQVRGMVNYPNQTGKKQNIIILDDAKIEEIAQSGKVNFDLALATPAMMPKLAKIAKILGPKGKMPNPKSGTITADPEKTKKELEGGQTEYRADSYGIVHQVIGKVSSDDKSLIENFNALIKELPQTKIESVYLTTSMGPSVKVQL